MVAAAVANDATALLPGFRWRAPSHDREGESSHMHDPPAA